VHDQITPVILTYNEASNIRRTLEGIRWAGDIVVVDSYSVDATLNIIASFPQARVFQRRFDSLSNQCNFALEETGIQTDWVLSLDADYILTPELVEELRKLAPDPATNAYRANFIYCIHGKRLRGCAYPPVTVLFRRKHARYIQDGHAHRVVVAGRTDDLNSPILHDDRKSLTHWLRSQDVYMQQELSKLGRANGNLYLPDRLRRTKLLFPFMIFFYCLFLKGGILDGLAGLYYAFQRMLAEILLTLYLIEEELRGEESGRLESDEVS